MKYLLLTLTALFLTACSTTTTITTHGTTPTTSLAAAQIINWSFAAKMSLKSEAQNGIVSLSWQQHHNDYQIEIEAPLGQGWLKLKGNEQQVHLQDSQGQEEIAQDANQLLVAYGYWPLPIEQFKYWLKGISAPGIVTHITYTAQGQIQTLQQQDWQIEYLETVQVNQQFTLPRKMKLSNPQLAIKLIIKSWEINT